MGDYLLLILSAFMFSAQIIFSKRYQTKNGDSFYAGSCFSLIVGIGCFLLTLVINGFKIRFCWYSFVLAFVFALIHTLIRLISIKTMSLGKVSIYTLFLMLGGMIVPFFVGVLFLGEQLKIHYILAIVLLIVALILPTLNFQGKNAEKKEKTSKLFLLLCLIIFLLNGSGSAIAKIHQVYEGVKLETFDFTVLFSLISMIMSFVVFLVASAKKEKLSSSKDALISGFGFAIVHMTGTMIQFITATRVDGSLLFPLVTGGTLIFTPILSAIIYKEKIEIVNIICIVLSFLATVIFAF